MQFLPVLDARQNEPSLSQNVPCPSIDQFLGDMRNPLPVTLWVDALVMFFV